VSGDALGKLAEFAFEGITFPVISAETEGGNDFAVHEAEGKPGADLESTGRKPFRGTFRIACLDGLVAPYGNFFSDHYVDVRNAFADHPIGDLAHPTHGLLTAGITDYKETLDPMVRSGLFIDVSWMEHNASASAIIQTVSASDPVVAATAADASGAACDAAVAA
jgi:prophage DNA circulation protein